MLTFNPFVMKLLLSCVLVLEILRFIETVSATATCYNPDGSVVSDIGQLPCNNFEGVFSQCCGLNRSDPDVCQSNVIYRYLAYAKLLRKLGISTYLHHPLICM